jgi:hypothetical protein
MKKRNKGQKSHEVEEYIQIERNRRKLEKVDMKNEY